MKKDSGNTTLPQKFLAVIGQHQLIGSKERVVLAVSGGSDSMTLLSLFLETFAKDRLIAVYINHGLRGEEAVKESRYIQTICHKSGISFYSKSVDVYGYAAKNGASIEESARILRYKTLREIAQQHDCSKIAVAHTADDQVENFFIRLIRGTGINGAKGMLYRQNDIIRPLLDCTKQELQDYLQQRDILWCEDSSNTDPSFLRNRIRLQLLPLLKKDFSSAINRHILQFMEILEGENRFIEQETEKIWQNLIQQAPSPSSALPVLLLAIEAFRQIDNALQRRIVEQCIIYMQGRPSFTHIEQIIQLTMGNNYGELHLSDGLRVEKNREHLLFHRPLLTRKEKRGSAKEPIPFMLTIDGPGIYQLPANGEKVEISLYQKEKKNPAMQAESTLIKPLYLDYDKLHFPLLLRPAIAGDRFYPCNGRGHKKIARYFSDKKIPLPRRKCWPLLVSGDQIAAIIGLEIENAFKITRSSKNILQVHYLNKSAKIESVLN